MGLEEETVTADRYGCPREMRNILGAPSFWIFTRDAIISYDMGCIEDHRTTDLLEDGDRAKI
jgi:hypothetical protein